MLTQETVARALYESDCRASNGVPVWGAIADRLRDAYLLNADAILALVQPALESRLGLARAVATSWGVLPGGARCDELAGEIMSILRPVKDEARRIVAEEGE